MKKPFYRILYVQVIFAIVIGILIGHFWPNIGQDLKPLGDGFIKLIKMVIGPIIFCTVVTGMGGMHDMKQVGRVGAKALIYFEVISTFALLIGLVAGHWIAPGSGFNVDPTHLDATAVKTYTDKAAHGESLVDFLMHIIPSTLFSAFSDGNILQILMVAVLFGSALSLLGQEGRVVNELCEKTAHVLFGMVNIITRLAPLGALGAMAFTIGKYGIVSLLPMLKLILTFYLTAILFVVVVLGTVAYYIAGNRSVLTGFSAKFSGEISRQDRKALRRLSVFSALDRRRKSAPERRQRSIPPMHRYLTTT